MLIGFLAWFILFSIYVDSFPYFQRFVAVPAIFYSCIISSFAMFLDEDMKGLDFMYNFN